MSDPEALRARNLVAAARWRLVLGVLAVVVPLTLFGLFRRQELRIRGLADHGRVTTGMIEEVTRQQGVAYTHYRYTVDGVPYTWSVSREDAPYNLGESFDVTYLPEVPSFSRPTIVASRERLEGEIQRPFEWAVVAGFFVFLAGGAVLCHRMLRRLQRGDPPRTGPRLSPTAAGRLLGVLFFAAAVGSSFDAKARAVQVALFGTPPWGLPIGVVVAVVTGVLFAPFFWVFPHLMQIVMRSAAEGGSLSKSGILFAVARAPADQARSRRIVVAGFVYLLIVVGAWIAYADRRGV